MLGIFAATMTLTEAFSAGSNNINNDEKRATEQGNFNLKKKKGGEKRGRNNVECTTTALEVGVNGQTFVRIQFWGYKVRYFFFTI